MSPVRIMTIALTAVFGLAFAEPATALDWPWGDHHHRDCGGCAGCHGCGGCAGGGFHPGHGHFDPYSAGPYAGSHYRVRGYRGFMPAPHRRMRRPYRRTPAVSPPPGTLGRTYRRPSRPVPTDKHPRTAMIEVNAPSAAEVTIEGVEDFEGYLGNDGLWHFESDTPLLPGIPHIYDVKAEFVRHGRPVTETRTVRMIPGRIVTLRIGPGRQVQ